MPCILLTLSRVLLFIIMYICLQVIFIVKLINLLLSLFATRYYSGEIKIFKFGWKLGSAITYSEMPLGRAKRLNRSSCRLERWVEWAQEIVYWISVHVGATWQIRLWTIVRGGWRRGLFPNYFGGNHVCRCGRQDADARQVPDGLHGETAGGTGDGIRTTNVHHTATQNHHLDRHRPVRATDQNLVSEQTSQGPQAAAANGRQAAAAAGRKWNWNQ